MSKSVFIPVHVASIVSRLRSEFGRREWRRLLECADYDRAAAWREYVGWVCPTIPEAWYEDVIEGARTALKLDRRPRIRRARRGA